MAEESIPEASQPQQADSTSPPRRGRRSGRGHRGRGRRRRPAPPQPHETPSSEQGSSEQLPEQEPAEAVETFEEPEAPGSAAETPPTETEVHAPKHSAPPPSRLRQPASPANIQKALQQVNDIINTLRDSLEEMEEVLETLEFFERQGEADEREIESLRRALRHLQRPRDGGQHHRGHG